MPSITSSADCNNLASLENACDVGSIVGLFASHDSRIVGNAFHNGSYTASGNNTWIDGSNSVGGNVFFEYNWVQDNRWGVMMDPSNGWVVRRNTFYSNSLSDPSGSILIKSFGGGIIYEYNRFLNNGVHTFTRKILDVSGFGNKVRFNEFRNNMGIALSLSNGFSDSDVIGNEFSSTYQSEHVYFFADASLPSRNITFALNNLGHGGRGRATTADQKMTLDSTSGTFSNMTFSNNRAAVDEAIGCVYQFRDDGDASIAQFTFMGNTQDQGIMFCDYTAATELDGGVYPKMGANNVNGEYVRMFYPVEDTIAAIACDAEHHGWMRVVTDADSTGVCVNGGAGAADSTCICIDDGSPAWEYAY